MIGNFDKEKKGVNTENGVLHDSGGGSDSDDYGLEGLDSVKIMDGLFIGDKNTAADFDFLKCNKVQFVINCATFDVPNHFRLKGIKYLNTEWHAN